MEKKKPKEEFEKEREEYLNLKKHKEDLERDPTLRPAKVISGWGSKLRSAKEEIKKGRMNEKLTIVRKKIP